MPLHDAPRTTAHAGVSPRDLRQQNTYFFYANYNIAPASSVQLLGSQLTNSEEFGFDPSTFSTERVPFSDLESRLLSFAK